VWLGAAVRKGPFIASGRWWRGGEVSFNIIGFDIESGRGVDKVLS
jgi:hypothetical protein